MKHFVIDPVVVSVKEREYTVNGYTTYLNGEKRAEATFTNIFGGETQVKDIETQIQLIKLIEQNNHSKKNKKLKNIKSKSIIV